MGVGSFDAVTFGDLPGPIGMARRDRHRTEAGLPIGDQMAFGHDKTSPDATDADVATLRHPGEVVEMVGVVHRICLG